MTDEKDKAREATTTATVDKSQWPRVESVHVGYLDAQQAAVYLAVSKPTIRRWCKNQGMPHYHLPGAGGKRGVLLFRKSEIDRWLRRFKNGLADSA